MTQDERERITDRLVKDDIGSIRKSLANGDITFLDSVLRGDGWVPYSQLTDKQLLKEWKSREEDVADWEFIYDSDYGPERNR